MLRRIYIEVTNKCNLNCATCMRNVWDTKYGAMSAETFTRIFDGAKKLSPQPEIFVGGYDEPLSHPRILDFIGHAKGLGFRVSLIPNGILLDQKMTHALIDLNLDMLWVSLDGASPESYTDI